jgi:tetratricopeptide (TPR) repeat protein
MFERAVVLDPGFALAFTELSIIHSLMVSLRIDTSQVRLARAEQAVNTALALEPDLPRAHLARALYLFLGLGDHDTALEELEIARRGKPNDAQVLMWTGRFLRVLGRQQEALAAFARARELEPRSYTVENELGKLLNHARRHQEADLAYERATALQPERLDAHLNRFWNALAWHGDTTHARQILDAIPAPEHRTACELRLFVLLCDRDFSGVLEFLRRMPEDSVVSPVWKWPRELSECHAFVGLGQKEQARRSCGRALSVTEAELTVRPNDPRLWVAKGNALALLGNREDAIQAGERALELVAGNAQDVSEFRMDLGRIAAMAGDVARATEVLEQSLAEPGWQTKAWVRHDWRYDNLRQDPRFQALVAPE